MVMISCPVCGRDFSTQEPFCPVCGETHPMKRLEETCIGLRLEILEAGQRLLELMDHPCYQDEQQFVRQHGEMKANTMLAYRHLEDARMRLGKVMQQIQGGTSIYDKSA